MLRAAALTYAFATAVVVLFQIALALGAPFGHLAMGGSVEGSFPPPMRVGALIQAALLVALGFIILRGAGVLSLPLPRRWLIWLPVAFAGLTTFLNTITPSSAERSLWLPVAVVLLITSLYVAMKGGQE